MTSAGNKNNCTHFGRPKASVATIAPAPEEHPTHDMLHIVSARIYEHRPPEPQPEEKPTTAEEGELPPEDARLLALVTEGRIGEALTLDVAALREWQKECLAIVAPATLKSISAILTLAESLAKSDRGIETLTWLSRWIRDLLLVHVGGDHDQILHLEQMDQLQEYARTTDLPLLLDLIKEIERTQQNATRNLNLHMALESCLLKLRDALGLAPAGTPA